MTLLRTLLQDLPVRYTLLLCIAIAAALIYLPFLLVAYGRLQAGYDMAKPRAIFDQLPDYAKRATWAHQNSFESFILFTAAALMAVVTQVESVWAAAAAIGYIAARFLFSLFYILNIPILRSLMFGVGTLAIGALFIISLQQAAP